uniref:Uncharacterized protein n=1 Tax=Panagrolaimus davidi TaxID=227884 RepID=A0A914Q7Z0_9BILA
MIYIFGSPMSDFARFLTHCCDGVVRRQAETFANEFYYEYLKEFGSNEKVLYIIEQLKKAYNYCFLSQAFYAITVVQLLLRGIPEKAENDEIKNAFHDFTEKKLFIFSKTRGNYFMEK